MEERTEPCVGGIKQTVFSLSRRYRYTLWRKVPVTFQFSERVWGGDCVQFIGLNPSTANETENDPTIRRCIRFASDWGFTWMAMTNLFGFVSSDPKVMMAQADPIGVNNDSYLLKVSEYAGLVVAAWGAFACATERARDVRRLIRKPIYHLGLNANGSPKHPLYLSKNTKPTIWL